MAQSSAASRIANLVLRVFTLILLFISLIVLCTNTKTLDTTDGGTTKFRFRNVVAYRYMLSAIVFGTAYSLLQLAFCIYNIVSKGEGNILFDFYGDKIISYVLATGAAAGFGVTKDMKDLVELLEIDLGNFYDKAYASASLLFLAFFCTAILSVLSSYALPKRV
ncbi:hypothetical protein UlMin_025667 [Ulmus minor]